MASIAPFLAELDMPGPIVSTNGAYVLGPNGEEILHQTLEFPAQKVIIDFAKSKNIHLNSYHLFETRFSNSGKFADLYVDRTQTKPKYQSYDELYQQKTTKLLFIDEPKKIVQYQKHLTPLLAPLNISIVISEPEYIEFLPPEINKGEGLKKLCEYLKIRPDEVAAIGDFTNDIEMMKFAGISGAVSNAHPIISKLANHMVGSNDDNGFSEFVDLILQHQNEGIVME